MCPRKSAEGKVAKWAYTMYKDKGKKLTFGPYECPMCARNNLSISVDTKNKIVTAACGCGFETKLTYVPSYEPIDYYNKVIDQIYHTTK